MPILPGLARFDEVSRGVIDHALRFTVQRTRRAYLFPARHFASELTDPTLPPMGLRVRLKASFDTSTFPPQARVVLDALKLYGMMVADNGSDWYVSGAPDPGWDDDDLHELGRVKGSDFEVLDTSSLGPPTSASVTAFSATRTGDRVILRWRAASEIGVLGYRVYRSSGARRSAVGPLVVAGGTGQRSYRVVDRRPGPSYLLQLVRADGSRGWLGPVSAR